MVRAIVVAVCLAALPASPRPSASSPPPPSSPARTVTPTPPPTPATKPSPDQLLAQAYAFMVDGKFDKASPLLNRAYNETPPAQRSRPLVLNRALLDLVQKANVVRGAKDLTEYFAANQKPDEEASNLLGAILELVANNSKWRDGPIYSAGLREFSRREAVLERAHPGQRRWGANWITEEELQGIKQKQKDQAEQAAAAYELVVRRTTDLQSIRAQLEHARTQYGGFRFHRHVGAQQYFSNCPQCMALFEARNSMNELGVEFDTGTARLQAAQRDYDRLQKRQIKAEWPTRFPPIDPAATEPPPLPTPPPQGLTATTKPTATTTAAATTTQAATQASNPFR